MLVEGDSAGRVLGGLGTVGFSPAYSRKSACKGLRAVGAVEFTDTYL